MNVYELSGRLVQNLYEGRIDENLSYRFEFNPDRGMASGTYIVRFILDNEHVITRQLILAK